MHQLLYIYLGPYEEIKLTVATPAGTIVRAMAALDSGLEIRDRMWLKITIPNAFIGTFFLLLEIFGSLLTAFFCCR